MLKTTKFCITIMLFALISATACHGQAVFLARKALGAVQHLTSSVTGSGSGAAPQQEVGSVLLEADANKVYATATRIIQGNPKYQIISRNDENRKIDFTDGKREAVLSVSQLQDNVAQILVSSVTAAGKKEDPAFVVDGILGVCKEMNVQCSLSGK
ncbi:MAG: hypothetical protein QG555_500 [Thermodesulfobacteriota bacterium]|nr:hypothetical protein [Thermodesulfobacteriota bacterium]